MNISTIAIFHSPFSSKFGIPRQSGLVDELRGTVELQAEYANTEALRGLCGYDYAWLIWGFSENVSAEKHPTVRPPRLGGNRRMGVFATRSPFRPNNLGLSSVRLVSVGDGMIEVAGADLMDGTPIYDIKPYIPFTDSHPLARGGFVDTQQWTTLQVVVPDHFRSLLPPNKMQILVAVLAQDPRPQYHDEPGRIYGMPFADCDVRFRVEGDTLTVTDIVTNVVRL